MNDLDKRIAELKGWRLFKPSETTPQEHAEWSESKAIWKPEASATWSTDDAKALELVDELDFPFELLTLSKTPAARWLARFHYPETQRYPEGGAGPTRPEAICRAYIAAREWMATKAEPVVKMDGMHFAKDGTLKRNLDRKATKESK